jgi:hypothetical protein
MRKIVFLSLALTLAAFAIPAHADPKPKDVNATVVNEPTVHVGTMPDVNFDGDVSVVNEPTVQIGNDEASPVPVTIVDGANTRQLYQSLHSASISPPANNVDVDIDDIPEGMRLVVESVSLSLLECDFGLVEYVRIRSYAPTESYIMLPLLNNPSDAYYSSCALPDYRAFYQSNNFLTKFYLENHASFGPPVIRVNVNTQLGATSSARLYVTLVGYLESITSP